jgi:hypothetical protein
MPRSSAAACHGSDVTRPDCPLRAAAACPIAAQNAEACDRRFGASTCGDDDSPLVRAEDSMENDSVADSDEADPETSETLTVPNPDTGRVVAPELIDSERQARHRRGLLDRLERWIP